MPVNLGYRLADFAADMLVSRQEQPMIQGLRSNLAVAANLPMGSLELDELVKRSMRFRARALFDFYHHFGEVQKIKDLVNYPQYFYKLLLVNQKRLQGTIVAMIHMGNPELFSLAGPLEGLKGMALTFPEETGGYKLLNEIRHQVGIQAIPSTMSALRLATQYLKDKGTVITGLDRPLPDSSYKPTFFGRSTPLPVYHVMLALRVKVPIVVLGGKKNEEGKYDVLMSDFIQMEKGGSRREELLHNTERLLKIAEGFINQAPEQWTMFYPLWTSENTS
jgi:KDO2-lipid IV(A) lauroyltransferase